MIKKSYLIAIFAIAFSYIYIYNNYNIPQNIYHIFLPIKQSIINNISKINIFFNKNLDYEKLKLENINLKMKISNQNILINEFNKFDYSQKLYLLNRKKAILVRTMSYQKLNDFSKIYLLNEKKLESNKFFGLIQNNLVSGIAIQRNNKLEGILVSNKDCKISVSIGKNRVPGIARGLNSQNMKIDSISKWDKIKIGDTVVTNGLDNIFTSNILVGKIVEITKSHPITEAIVKFEADIKYPNYFYLITSK